MLPGCFGCARIQPHGIRVFRRPRRTYVALNLPADWDATTYARPFAFRDARGAAAMTNGDPRSRVLEAVLADLAQAVPAALGPNCLAVFFTGSASAGALHPLVQDVDLLYVTEAPARMRELVALREALDDVAARHADAETRVVWHVVAGPWKPEPVAGQWTIALHGNLMSRRQLAKLARHQANIATTMYASGRALAGPHPQELEPAGCVTADLQLRRVFGLRWLRDLLYSVSACTLGVRPLEPVLADVVQYTVLTGAKNAALLGRADDGAAVTEVVEHVRTWKLSGDPRVEEGLLQAAYEALFALAASVEGGACD